MKLKKLNIKKITKFVGIFYIRVVVGLLIMFIPGSKCYASICSSIDPNEYKIAEFLIYFCGVITIFLNKYIMNKILRIKRWKM